MNRAFVETMVKMALMTTVIIAAMPEFSWAATLADSVTTLNKGIGGIPGLVSAALYGAGGIAFWSGGKDFIDVSKNPDQKPHGIKSGATKAAIGAMFVASPASLGYILASINTQNTAVTYTSLGTATN